jgi:hypothetical protein
MQTEKNKWIEDVLGSADHAVRASGPDMSSRVMTRAISKPAPSGILWRVAASVALLVALNIGTMLVYGSYHSVEHRDHPQDITSSLGLGTADSQIDIGTVFFGN